MHWASQQQGWFKFTYIIKVRSNEYSDLLWTVSQQLSDNFTVENYLVEETWRMWSISERHLNLHVHKLNEEPPNRVLLRKGFTLTPDSEMVIRIPSGAQHSTNEVASKTGSVGFLHTTEGVRPCSADS